MWLAVELLLLREVSSLKEARTREKEGVMESLWCDGVESGGWEKEEGGRTETQAFRKESLTKIYIRMSFTKLRALNLYPRTAVDVQTRR